MYIPKGVIIIAVIVLLAGTIIGYRSCRIAGEYADLKAQYEDAKKVAAADHEIQTALIETKTKEISQLTKEISQILANAGKPTPGELAKDKELADLRKSWANLSMECQAKLHELDAKWIEKFTLTENRYKGDILTLNSTWQLKFDAQVVISDSWKRQYEQEVALLVLAEKAMASADAKIRVLQLTGKLKWGLVAVGIVVGHFVWR